MTQLIEGKFPKFGFTVADQFPESLVGKKMSPGSAVNKYQPRTGLGEPFTKISCFANQASRPRPRFTSVIHP
jgi:hypothetical protein